MNRRYLIDIQGKISGPHHVWELAKMRDAGSLPDETKVIYENEQWWAASLLKDSPKLLAEFDALKSASNTPVPAYHSQMLAEAREQNDHLSSIKWSLRAIAFMIAVILLFGFRVIFWVK